MASIIPGWHDQQWQWPCQYSTFPGDFIKVQQMLMFPSWLAPLFLEAWLDRYLDLEIDVE